ncbi:hypothetical protein Clacol_005966 [Clathrus columnatus]|uniref:Major facilitator superfamily (MFS) profile domain-containing protein n=1 Tax=Clathrus columnatus TaxID=1419009 RepID=A0AAV5AGC3_9AGAM|nr:hypothetical protein Clacol_005966 [Clathrus columnatus]
MASETTPLLQSRPVDPYERFTFQKKKNITLVISLAGIIAHQLREPHFTTAFASGCFIPTIPQIAKDLNTTGEVIKYVNTDLLSYHYADVDVSYTVGAYIFLIAVDGRQPVYLSSLPMVALGSIITAAANSITVLVIGRCIQAFGASCVQAVGAATISDIYRLEERGTGMGIFFAAILLGLPLAPMIGGALATYASWRVMQLCLAVMGLGIATVVYVYLPETSHPGARGMDKLLAQERAKSIENGTNDEGEESENKTSSSWRWVWLSPFSTLTLLKSPVILILASSFHIVLSSAFALMTYYFLVIPLAFTLGEAYGLNTPAAIGLCFLPSGAGNIVGATVAGRLADIAIIRGKKQRQGSWFPEDRLKATIPGGLILLPFSLIIFGLTTAYVPGKVGLVICLICLFLNGMGIDTVLAPSATYLVDIVRHRGAEAMAVSGAFRHVFSAVASAAVLPIINSTGVAIANGIAAICAWIAFGVYFRAKNGRNSGNVSLSILNLWTKFA